jgi:hypothetical protein
MGVDGVGVGGRSASDDAGALAVEFFLFGRCRHVSELLYHYRHKRAKEAYLARLFLAFLLWSCLV